MESIEAVVELITVVQEDWKPLGGDDEQLKTTRCCCSGVSSRAIMCVRSIYARSSYRLFNFRRSTLPAWLCCCGGAEEEGDVRSLIEQTNRICGRRRSTEKRDLLAPSM